MARECKFCKYIDKTGGHGGQCKRYPPTVHTLTNANGETDWSNERPYVGNDDTCGEFDSGP